MEQKVIPLLLDCLHQDAGRVTVDRLSSLTCEEWEWLLTLAREQQVSGLLYQRIRSRGLESPIPHEISHALRQTCQRIAANNLRLYAELRRIVSALHASRIPVIALKGAYVATVLYENLAAREMRDMDLMVPAGNLGQGAEIVESLGYKPMYPYTIDGAIATSLHLPPFIKPLVAAVELHWNVTNPNHNYSINPGELWERAVPARIAGVDILGLCPEDMLLHLCCHASYHHRFEFGLRPSCDIAETIRHFGDSLAWQQVLERARRWRWERGVYAALRLAKELVGATVPDEVLQDLRPAGFDETMITTARTQILLTNRSLANAMSPNLARLWHTAGLTGKIGIFLGRVFLPRAEISEIYAIRPNSLRIYLCYLLRFKDVLSRHARMAFDLLRGDPTLTSIAQHKALLQNWLEKE